MIANFEFVYFVVPLDFVFDLRSDVWISILIVQDEFCKTFAKHGVVVLVEGKGTMRETFVCVSVIDGTACSGWFAMAAKSQVRAYRTR